VFKRRSGLPPQPLYVVVPEQLDHSYFTFSPKSRDQAESDHSVVASLVQIIFHCCSSQQANHGSFNKPRFCLPGGGSLPGALARQHVHPSANASSNSVHTAYSARTRLYRLSTDRLGEDDSFRTTNSPRACKGPVWHLRTGAYADKVSQSAIWHS